MSTSPFDGTVHAPDFPPTLEWLNTAAPLTLEQLRGKLVLLDFWTYCCINCMHIIPDLKRLEAKYARELVVIGVHSAKFDNERDSENIRAATERYEIEHPVINDRDFQVWRMYEAHAWPTLVLINPLGRIIGSHSGEAIFDLFDNVIGEGIKYFDAKGEIDRRPLEFSEKTRPPQMIFSYPGKVVADANAGLLVFSDSNHNRIVVAGLDGTIQEVIGDGTAGLRDGDFASARFFRPQGVCLDPAAGAIYVADTENHALRLIDLKARRVITLCGNGRQGRGFNAAAAAIELNSPWDLLRVGDALYVTMAGPHQLWRFKLKTREMEVFAGNGREDIIDGPLKRASLAQPSGITTDGTRLYFADSEVSAVRAADLDPDGNVATLIGHGLFEFGDVDGRRPEARLQHCLGVHYHAGALYIADTYNHKIKRYDLATGELSTFIGTGQRGWKDGPRLSARLNEPAGLWFAADKLYIADTNNHLIRVFDFTTDAITTMAFSGLERLGPPAGDLATVTPIALARREVAPEVDALEFALEFADGHHLNPAAKSRLHLTSDNPAAARLAVADWELAAQPLTIPIVLQPGAATLTASVTLYYCGEAGAALCFLHEAELRIPLRIDAGGKRHLLVDYRVGG